MDDLNIQAGVTVNAEQAERAFTALGDKAQKMANEVTKAADKAGKATDGMGDGAEKGADKFTRAESRMRAAIQKSTRELEMLGKTASQKFEAQLEFKGLDKAKFQPFLAELRKTEEAAAKAQAGVSGIGEAAKVAGSMMAAAFSGAALVGVVGKVVSVQREFDVLNSSLKTVTGSSEAAERELSWLKTFAKETPFGLAQATQGFVKMKALGLDPTRAALTSFGNTASAMGKDLNQMIEAVADASTGEFERLKEFGIKAKKEGDNVSITFQGVTTTIKNSAAEITAYLEKIGNNQFGGAMEERAKTLDGTIAALGDTWDELFRTVSTNNVGGLIFDSVTLANGALEDATTILRALGGAAQDAGRDTGALSTIQSGIATVFETVAVLGANLKFVLVGIGNEIGGLAAQVAQAAQFNFSGVASIRRAMVADAEAARKEIDATTARILNARKAQEEYARYATRNASAATDPRRVDLGGSAPRATGGVSSGTAKAVKETISEYDKLIKKLSDELPRAAAEAEAAQMGYNKSQTEFLALAGSPAWASFTNSQRAVVASMFEGKIASEEAGEAAKALSKSYAEAAAERIKTIQSMERAADSLQSQNDALREEIELIGLSTEQQTLVLQQRNDVIILTKEATMAELERQSAITGTQTRVEIALASEIEALKERNALLGAKGVKNAAVDAAKSAADEWQKTSDKINDTLTDALMRGFESGKDFAKNLRDTVINMFKTMVLRPVISPIVNPVAGAVTSALGLSGAQGGGNSIMGGIQTASNLNTLYGAGSQALFGGAAGASAASLGYANVVGMAGGDAIGALAAANGMWAGVATGAQAAAQAAIASNAAMAAGTAAALPAGTTAAAAGAGAGAGGASGALAAIPGWGWALAGVAALGSVLSRKTEKRGSGLMGTLGEEDGVRDLDLMRKGGSLFSGPKWFVRDMGVSGMDDALQETYKAQRDALMQMGDALGLATAGVENFTVQLGTDTLGDQKVRGIRLDGLSDQEANAKIAEALATANNEIAQQIIGSWEDVATTAVRYIEQSSSDGGGWFDAVPEESTTRSYVNSEFARDGEKAIDTLTRLATSLMGVNSVFENLGYTLYEASLAGGDMASQLVDMFGSRDAFNQATGAFFQNFYSVEDQRAAAQRGLQAQLDTLDMGLVLPDIDVSDARDQFRALAEAQDRSTEEGQKAWAMLMQLSGAFAGVTQSADDAREAARKLAEEQARAAKAAQDAAYDNLRRAIDRDRSILQDQASMLSDTIGSIADAVSMLKTNARELYGTVDSTAQMLAAQGMVYIENALSGVRAGGSVADYTGLSDAIGAARSGIDSGSYATQFDRERDALVLAGQLSELGTLGDAQLSIEERQLKAVNAQIEYLDNLAKRADELVNGTAALTDTVDGYFAKLLALLSPDAETGKPPAPGGSAEVIGGTEGGWPTNPQMTPGKHDDGWYRQQVLLGGNSAVKVDQKTSDKLDRLKSDVFDKYAGTGDVEGYLNAIKAAGGSLLDASTLGGWDYGDLVKRADEYGIPRFASGGVHAGGLRVVGERGWEVEATGPARIWNQQQLASALGGGQGNAELVAEVRALRQEVAALRASGDATARNTAGMPQMADQFDTVTNGGNAMRAKALA